MRNVRFLCLLLVCSCLLAMAVPSFAQEVDCDAAYCFVPEDFGNGEEPITGICITGLPDSDAGTVMLGSRVLCNGDILTAEQVKAMTFHPLSTVENREAQVTYLPI